MSICLPPSTRQFLAWVVAPHESLSCAYSGGMYWCHTIPYLHILLSIHDCVSYRGTDSSIDFLMADTALVIKWRAERKIIAVFAAPHVLFCSFGSAWWYQQSATAWQCIVHLRSTTTIIACLSTLGLPYCHNICRAATLTTLVNFRCDERFFILGGISSRIIPLARRGKLSQWEGGYLTPGNGPKNCLTKLFHRGSLPTNLPGLCSCGMVLSFDKVHWQWPKWMVTTILVGNFWLLGGSLPPR